MELFTQKPDMLIELDKLEHLMPKYAALLLKLSKIIRHKIWSNSDEQRLAATLQKFNRPFSLFISVTGSFVDYAEWYAKLLCKLSDRFTDVPIDGVFDKFMNDVYDIKNQEVIKESWKQLNPLFASDYDDGDKFSKSILDLIDDVFTESITPNESEFLIELGTITKMCRGRKGVHREICELFPPPIGKGSINRWNPPDKQYIYLVPVWGKLQSDDECEKVCIEEIRATVEQDISFMDFIPVQCAENKKILVLDYEDITKEDLDRDVAIYQHQASAEIIAEYLPEVIAKHTMPPETEIKAKIEERTASNRSLTEIYCGKLFLVEFCHAIFTPIDDGMVKNDNKYKEKCYKSFHILAEFLEKRNIAGILYPSTRMKLIGGEGTNIVLFNPADVTPIDGTIRQSVQGG
jgi:hypothetical protein